MFNINGIIWDVLYVDPDDPYLKRSDGTYSIGACDNNTKFIYINNTLHGNKLKKVLCHEITHAAMFSYEVKLTLEQEEFIADLIATHGQEIIDITNKINGV
nr:MAG TPA: PolyVal Metallopeptidase superfamily domain [Caudoviricetes sp.]